LAFLDLSLSASFVGIGISRSLYAFGVHPLSGLWLTRTVDSMSECPSHSWTVRRSTRAQRHRVAKVARNL
jgi:hypothetical protein